MAEQWGLMHQSAGEGARRRLVVWKPSRSRRSLKPEMLEGLSSDSEEEGDGGEPPGEAGGSGDGGEGGSEEAGPGGSAAGSEPVVGAPA